MSDDWRNDPRFKSSVADEKEYQKNKKTDAKYTKIGLILLGIPIIGFFGLGTLGLMWNLFYDLGSFGKLVPGLILIIVLIILILIDIPRALTKAFNKYADFNGTATRTEFWLYYLYAFIYVLVFQFADWFSGITAMIFYSGKYTEFAESFIVVMVFQLFIFIPSLAIGARRLHGIGRSGWWQLLILTGIGIILLFVWWSTKETVESTTKKSINKSESDTATKLRELNQLYKEGVLTKEEFAEAKKKYL